MNNHYKNLVKFIDSLILSDARSTTDGYELRFEDISGNDKLAIAALFLEYDDRDLFCITENKNQDDITSSLIKFLKGNNNVNALDFAKNIKTNIVSYYENKIRALIDERLVEVEQESAWQDRMYKIRDRQTGEHSWSQL